MVWDHEMWRGALKRGLGSPNVVWNLRYCMGILELWVKPGNVSKCPKTWGGQGICVACLAVENRLKWLREEKGLGKPDPLLYQTLNENSRP